MIRSIARSVIAVVLALILALALIIGIELVSSMLHPLPPGLDPGDLEVLKGHVPSDIDYRDPAHDAAFRRWRAHGRIMGLR